MKGLGDTLAAFTVEVVLPVGGVVLGAFLLARVTRWWCESCAASEASVIPAPTGER